jgi:hypothetical protein
VVKLPSGVAFHWVRRNGETRTFGSDRSGRGAVLSSWGLYVDLAAAREICPEYLNKPLETDLANAVDKINDFIVANSLFPVSKVGLEKRAASRWEDVSRLCRSATSLECLSPSNPCRMTSA